MRASLTFFGIFLTAMAKAKKLSSRIYSTGFRASFTDKKDYLGLAMEVNLFLPNLTVIAKSK